MPLSPTYDETYNDLFRLTGIIHTALYDLGKIRGRNDLQSEKDLRYLVLDVSKKIVQALPSEQSEDDRITDAAAKLSTVLNRIANPDDETNDFEVTTPRPKGTGLLRID